MGNTHAAGQLQTPNVSLPAQVWVPVSAAVWSPTLVDPLGFTLMFSEPPKVRQPQQYNLGKGPLTSGIRAFALLRLISVPGCEAPPRAKRTAMHFLGTRRAEKNHGGVNAAQRSAE